MGLREPTIGLPEVWGLLCLKAGPQGSDWETVCPSSSGSLQTHPKLNAASALYLTKDREPLMSSQVQCVKGDVCCSAKATLIGSGLQRSKMADSCSNRSDTSHCQSYRLKPTTSAGHLTQVSSQSRALTLQERCDFLRNIRHNARSFIIPWAIEVGFSTYWVFTGYTIKSDEVPNMTVMHKNEPPHHQPVLPSADRQGWDSPGTQRFN